MWSWANPQLRAAVVCVLVALVYLFMWPGRKNPASFRQLPLWRRIVLRCFHSLTWLVIGAACLLWSKFLVVAAAAIYVVYLAVASHARPTTER